MLYGDASSYYAARLQLATGLPFRPAVVTDLLTYRALAAALMSKGRDDFARWLHTARQRLHTADWQDMQRRWRKDVVVWGQRRQRQLARYIQDVRGDRRATVAWLSLCLTVIISIALVALLLSRGPEPAQGSDNRQGPPDISGPILQGNDLYTGGYGQEVGCYATQSTPEARVVAAPAADPWNQQGDPFFLLTVRGRDTERYYVENTVSDEVAQAVSLIMAPGRRIKIRYVTCGGNAFKYLTYLEPLPGNGR
jgi:hypothetical protein